jgi:FkbM family methyltransferase
LSQQTLHQREVAQATLQGPGGPLPFNLFKTDVSFQVADNIFAGATYPAISFVSDVKTIVDIGANVGAASVYFAIAYPHAQVYAFEPGSAPLSLLRQNVEPLRNVTVFPFGLHAREQRLSLFQGKNDSVESSLCSTSRTSSESEEVRLVCAPDFLASQSVDRIDILKIDTEGCEVPILRSLNAYLPEVKALYVEYHSERDRRLIDAMLAGTHVLWRGHVSFAYRGEFCYLKRELVPDESETHTCEILMDWE